MGNREAMLGLLKREYEARGKGDLENLVTALSYRRRVHVGWR
jgi:hypothetical protein